MTPKVLSFELGLGNILVTKVIAIVVYFHHQRGCRTTCADDKELATFFWASTQQTHVFVVVMLDIVPLEILEIILSHLERATSVINLSLANRKLHKRISTDKYALLRSFVQARFPSIDIPPFWRDATIALTARSRAWDRRAFVARECALPGENELSETGVRIPSGLKTGFVPAIDSYEAWNGSTWTEKKEVLAWGAAGRLSLRTIRNGKTSSSVYRTSFDHSPVNDIMDVRLLRPRQNINAHGETIILRRANDTIIKIASKPKTDIFEHVTIFELGPKPQSIEAIDLNASADPLVAVCNATEVRLYHANSEKPRTSACDVLELAKRHEQKHRIRNAKFLSPARLALGVQFLEGKGRAPIEIYEITPTGVAGTLAHIRDGAVQHVAGRHCANAIISLDATSSLAGRPGNVFLSGWTDGVVRLYDLRSNGAPSLEYHDTVDDGQILSLLAIGHEKILAGSHQNACLKTWDMRMSGGRAYSYAGCMPSVRATRPMKQTMRSSSQPYTTRRDINIFLALHIPRARRLWECLPTRPDPRTPRYRGAVYSLSSPSPSSTSVYAGIENHVIQLDFVSTDDVREGRLNSHGLRPPDMTARSRPVLDLSCYERPQPGYEIFDPILLRKQVDVPGCWSSLTGPRREGAIPDPGLEAGWDERWRLSTCSRGESSLAWR